MSGYRSNGSGTGSGNVDDQFIPIGDEYTMGTYGGKVLSDGVTSTIRKTFRNTLMTFSGAYIVVLHTGTGGAIRYSVSTNIASCSEGYQIHTDSISATDSASISADTITCIDITDAFTDMSLNDIIGFEFTRYGGHVNDAINDDLYILGILFSKS